MTDSTDDSETYRITKEQAEELLNYRGQALGWASMSLVAGVLATVFAHAPDSGGDPFGQGVLVATLGIGAILSLALILVENESLEEVSAGVTGEEWLEVKGGEER